MFISVVVTVNPEDTFDMSNEEVADAMFQALGADEDVDTCVATIQQAPSDTATVGKQKPPEEPKEPK